MRRYDFDAEAVVRLSWRGVPAINQPAPVRYFRAAEGGVSHFRYGRDNLLRCICACRIVYAPLWPSRTAALLGARKQFSHPAIDRNELAGDIAGASEARNATSSATSSGCPARCIGTSRAMVSFGKTSSSPATR